MPGARYAHLTQFSLLAKACWAICSGKPHGIRHDVVGLNGISEDAASNVQAFSVNERQTFLQRFIRAVSSDILYMIAVVARLIYHWKTRPIYPCISFIYFLFVKRKIYLVCRYGLPISSCIVFFYIFGASKTGVNNSSRGLTPSQSIP